MPTNLQISPLTDKALYNLTCAQQAAQHLNLTTTLLGKFNDILQVNTPNFPLYFWRNRHPFNNGFSELAQDKLIQYQIFQSLPPSPSLYFPKFIFLSYSKLISSTPELLSSSILNHLHFPFIIKKNRSSFSRNVFLVENQSDLLKTLPNLIPTLTPSDYLIFQEYIQGKEYRVINHNDQLKIAYSKRGNSRFTNTPINTPTNHLNSTLASQDDDFFPEALTDPNHLLLAEKAIKTLYSHLNLTFTGTDLIITPNNKTYLIEINYFPVLYHFGSKISHDKVIQVYSELLQEYLH